MFPQDYTNYGTLGYAADDLEPYEPNPRKRKKSLYAPDDEDNDYVPSEQERAPEVPPDIPPPPPPQEGPRGIPLGQIPQGPPPQQQAGPSMPIPQGAPAAQTPPLAQIQNPPGMPIPQGAPAARTPGFVNQQTLAPPPPSPSAASQPQQPLPQVPQGVQHPSVLRRIGGALAGYLSGGGIPGMFEGAAHPGRREQQQQLGQQIALQQQQAKMAQEQAQIGAIGAQAEYNRAHAKLAAQQADTLAAEGKLPPKGDFVTVQDGLYDAANRRWIREPSDKSLTKDREVSATVGQAVGAVPNANGKYVIPEGVWQDYIKGTMKPDRTVSTDQQILDTAALVVAQKHGLKLDDSKPLMGQLPPALRAEAAQEHKRLNALPPSDLDIELKKSLLAQRSATQNAMTGDAIDMAARSWLQTRQMPPVGRRPEVAMRIMDRAAKIARDEMGLSPEDVGIDQARFKAGQQSLSDITKRMNQIGAFERTAAKNLDVFMNQAKNVVDTGSPLANRVFRGGQRELTGGLEAFDAARITAFTEVSRVLSGSMSSVLSDSARKEAEQIIKGDYTIPGLMRAVAVLRQDMRNRMDSFREQQAEITGMMKPGTKATASAPSASPVANPNPTGYVKGHVYGGMTYLGGDPNNPTSWKK